jgi:hypothetical protein
MTSRRRRRSKRTTTTITGRCDVATAIDIAPFPNESSCIDSLFSGEVLLWNRSMVILVINSRVIPHVQIIMMWLIIMNVMMMLMMLVLCPVLFSKIK